MWRIQIPGGTQEQTHKLTLLLYQHLSALIKLSLEWFYKNIASFFMAPVEFAGLEADTAVIRLGKLNMSDVWKQLHVWKTLMSGGNFSEYVDI